MELLVLNENFTAIKLLDTFESLLWVERYYSCGDFELYVPMNLELFKTIRQDYYLWSNEANNAMIIETKQIETDVEDGSKLAITGRGLESILERRVIFYQTILSGSFQDGIEKLLNENIISPTDANRRIDNFIFEASSDPTILSLTIDAQFHGENLYETIQTLCEANKIGFEVILNEDNWFVFRLYCGKDRSYEQNVNPYVIFSTDFDNLINSNYLESKKTLKTFALIGGEGTGSERKMTTATVSGGGGTGLARREIFVEASGVSKNVDGVEISDAEYYAQLKQKGIEELSVNVETKTFEGQCDTTKMFVYGEDFFMGDVVQVSNEFGVDARTRVIEFIRSYDENGIDTYPTFETVDSDIVLPEGYTRYAYIEASGTQFIDTEVIPSNDTKLILDIEIHTPGTDWRGVCGSRELVSGTLTNMFAVFLTYETHPSPNMFHVNNGDSYTEFTPYTLSRYNIELNDNVVTINGNVHEFEKVNITSTLSMYLFASNDGGNPCHISDIRIYACEIFERGIMVKNFIPCGNPSGDVGLYDLVSNKFHNNKGTGNFVAGPVIS